MGGFSMGGMGGMGGGDMWGAIIQGLSEVGSAALEAAERKAQAKKQWSRWKRSLLMGPTLMMQGLRDAGLNPILAAGAGPPTYSGGGGVSPAHSISAARTLQATSKVGLERDALMAQAASARAAAGEATNRAQTDAALRPFRVSEAQSAAALRGAEGVRVQLENEINQTRNEYLRTPEGRRLIKLKAIRDASPGGVGSALSTGVTGAVNSATSWWDQHKEGLRQYGHDLVEGFRQKGYLPPQGGK